MHLYLDDDLAQGLLARLLRHGGHDVRMPADLGVGGAHDALHFKHAMREGRVILSGNHKDFEFLHELVLEAQGRHPGILIVRRDNNPKRDLTPKGIVRAISNLLTAQVPMVDQFLVLNHWR